MLKGYRLDFNYYSKRWKGAAATIEEDCDKHVWGVIWELDEEHLKTLDEQEGVQQGIYRPVTVTAETPAGERLRCRSYQLVTPPERDRRPSAVYKDVIERGAAENQLPAEYRARLAAIEDNGYRGQVEVALDLAQR
ncbi:Gamma-glutamylcyclotransferase [Amphibalanus amphitrite]|uniref:gamma-glutamylcyclotransferase n=1 Tax=Amphibalanus amphitrite TaxID=1232801 RepID=A0A6A4WDQ9_AMPAM|nr:Gamma-glutamylcyclotransferase [Amphibalanus amphitrite]